MNKTVNAYLCHAGWASVRQPGVQADAMRTRTAKGAGFSEACVVTYLIDKKDADPLPNCRLQEHHARGSRRAEAVRVALHAFAGSELLRNAARNCVGKCSARSSTRDHAVYHRKRRAFSARSNKRNAPDRRFESAHLEHIPDADESARKPGSCEYAIFSRPYRGPSLVCCHANLLDSSLCQL